MNTDIISETYRYQDDNSDKFWRIEYASDALAVNYGKTGTIGKYQMKWFDTEEECKKEANKLIASKVKKGYKPYPEFDMNRHFYMDCRDEDTSRGPHPLTSHPKFRQHFTDEFYYDSGEDAAPFGNDEGAETLYTLEDDVRKYKAFDFISFPQKYVTESWGMTYYSPTENTSKDDIENVLKTDEGEMGLTNGDIVIYATALAQVKITGRIDTELKMMAINAMKRKLISDEILGYDYANETLKKNDK